MRPSAPSSAIQPRRDDAALCRAQEGATQHGAQRAMPSGASRFPLIGESPRRGEIFQAHAVSGMPGSGQRPFQGLQDSPGSSSPLNMGSSLFVAKTTGAAHGGRSSSRKRPATLMCSAKAKRQQPRQAPRRLFFVDPRKRKLELLHPDASTRGANGESRGVSHTFRPTRLASLI